MHYHSQSLQKLTSSSLDNRLKACLQFLIIKVNENADSSSYETSSRISIHSETKKSENIKHIDKGSDANCHHQDEKRRRLIDEELGNSSPEQVTSTQEADCPQQSESENQHCQTEDMTRLIIFRPCTNQVKETNGLLPSSTNNDETCNYYAGTVSSGNFMGTQFTQPEEPKYFSENYRTNRRDTEDEDEEVVTRDSNENHDETDRDDDDTSDSVSSTGSVTSTCSSSTTSSSSLSQRTLISPFQWRSEFVSSPISSCSSPLGTGAAVAAATTRSSTSTPISSMLSSSPELVGKKIKQQHYDLKRPKLKLTLKRIRKIESRPLGFQHLINGEPKKERLRETLIKSGKQQSFKLLASSTGNQSSVFKETRDGQALVSANTTSLVKQMHQCDYKYARTNIMHSFQAAPKFVNNLLKACSPGEPKQPQSTIITNIYRCSDSIELNQVNKGSNTTTTSNNNNNNNNHNSNNYKKFLQQSPLKGDLFRSCAVCGIKDKSVETSIAYGADTCSICANFFTSFLDRPILFYCRQDGDCLMTFDSRCKACWIKRCLQKFNINSKDDEHHRDRRLICLKYSPRLLSAPEVSLINLDKRFFQDH